MQRTFHFRSLIFLLTWTLSFIVINQLKFIYASGGFINGSPISCDKEGAPVDVRIISNNPCISCICQNKEVKCHKEKCPKNKSCYLLLFGQQNKTCCESCKGCMQKDHFYQNGEEWTDPDNPCKQYNCQGGIITETKIHCYVPCRSPDPPVPGKCCPTCPGCKSDDAKGTDDFDLSMSLTDPCVKCKCSNNSMVCTKKACPVLPCPSSKYQQRPGTCCPKCIGTRHGYKVDDRCILGMHVFKSGDQMQYDTCTHCQCTGSTSSCQRMSCPPLDCWPEQQVKDVEDCCPKCRSPEESKAVCVANGKIYEDKERWKMEKCTHCVCKGGQVHCSVDPCEIITTCPPKHTLKTLPGACCATCVEDDAVCTVFGDPHYKTFDGKMFNYQGSCKYLLVKDCKSKSFSVEVLNDARYSKSFSWTKTVTIKVNGTKIRLGQNLKMHVNHKPVKLPYVQLGVLSVFQEDNTALVRTNIGVKLMWDGNSFLEISVPSKYKSELCGLCGNYNGIKDDDFMTKKGKQVTTAEEFGNSWRVGRMKRCTMTQPTATDSTCKIWETRIRTIKECNVLKSSVFLPCHRIIDPFPYYDSCRVDACECRPRDRCYCESFTAYARECARAGKELTNWREATGCDGGRCINGQQFMKCAPTCRRTCKKPKKDRACGRQCRPGCYCPPGTVWHKRRCIPLDECPTQQNN